MLRVYVMLSPREIQLHVTVPMRKYAGRFITFSVITNIYNKKTIEPTLIELFTATGKLKKLFF
jgi:hypothetical protein